MRKTLNNTLEFRKQVQTGFTAVLGYSVAFSVASWIINYPFVSPSAAKWRVWGAGVETRMGLDLTHAAHCRAQNSQLQHILHTGAMYDVP